MKRSHFRIYRDSGKARIIPSSPLGWIIIISHLAIGIFLISLALRLLTPFGDPAWLLMGIMVVGIFIMFFSLLYIARRMGKVIDRR